MTIYIIKKVILYHLGSDFMGKFYAVRKGKKTGVFESWNECELQVKGYPGAQYKSFPNKIDAELYLDYSEAKHTILSKDVLQVYVDGSYSKDQNRAGFGCVFVKDGIILKEFSLETSIPPNDNLWNVSAEIAGVLYAVDWCVEKRIPSVNIFYDYEGLRSWYDGSWKATKPTTINYVNKMNELKKSIHIEFSKVKAHSGDYFNEKADDLAKKAILNVNESTSIKNNLILDIDIYLTLSEFKQIIGNIETEKINIICKGFYLNDRIINKLAKYFWKKDKNKINDLASMIITFDVDSMILNIDYYQKQTNNITTTKLKLEGN